MGSALEKIEKNKVSLEIEVDVNAVSESLKKAYHKVVRKVNVPGFRKGKVPRLILEARFGKEVLYEDALDIIVPQAYQDALQEHDLVPIEQPEIDVKQFEADKPLIFTVIVEVLPEAKLGEYKGIEAVKPEVKVGDDEVGGQLKVLQDRHARLDDDSEGQVDDGDMAVVDIEATVDGQAEPRLTAQAQTIEVGASKFIPGFEAHILGTKLGEEKEFSLNLPSKFQYADLEGKEAQLKVKIAGIKCKVLSLIDDEFARDVSDCTDLESLKDQIKNRLEETGHLNARRIFTERVLQKVVEQAEVEIPPVLVSRQVEEETNSFVQRLAYQQMNLDDYLRFTQSNMDKLREDLTHRSEDIVKQRLVLRSIAKAEGIKVTPEELNSEVNDLASQYGMDAAKIRQTLEEKDQLKGLEQDILTGKVQEMLAETAVELPDVTEALVETEAEKGPTGSETATETVVETDQTGKND
jgi:trigger factor